MISNWKTGNKVRDLYIFLIILQSHNLSQALQYGFNWFPSKATRLYAQIKIFGIPEARNNRFSILNMINEP